MKQKTTIIFCLGLAAAFALSCSKDRATTQYETHPNDWNSPGSADFHGPWSQRTASESCAGCHGEDFLGGESGVSCYSCHAGYPHAGFDVAADRHANRVADLNWNLNSCQSCHGVDFAGGKVGVSCRQCHTAAAGPAACNNCHGDPPVHNGGLLRGMPAGSYGAHAVHAIQKGYACTECHASVNGLDHTGALPAEVSFAQAEIAYRPPFATSYAHLGDFLSGNGTCATYCHSDARGGAPLVNVDWVNGRLTACQSCHAVPPATPGHSTEGRCHLCHTHVDPTSNYNIPDSIRFLDPTLHVNGVVNIEFNP